MNFLSCMARRKAISNGHFYQWKVLYAFPCNMASELHEIFYYHFYDKNFLSYMATIKWNPQHLSQLN